MWVTWGITVAICGVLIASVYFDTHDEAALVSEVKSFVAQLL
jgi:hypothetical protein